MDFIPTNIPDVILIRPRLFTDARGYFFESYNEKLFKEHGIHAPLVQHNQSYSQYGVLRGLHAQKEPYAQSKLIQVIRGRILDIALDIRVNSPYFGKYVALELNEHNNEQLFIPQGFLHGFLSLSEHTILNYKCDALYHAPSEISVNPFDPDLNLPWPLKQEQCILSLKDQNAPSFKSLLNHLTTA